MTIPSTGRRRPEERFLAAGAVLVAIGLTLFAMLRPAPPLQFPPMPAGAVLTQPATTTVDTTVAAPPRRAACSGGRRGSSYPHCLSRSEANPQGPRTETSRARRPQSGRAPARAQELLDELRSSGAQPRI